MCVLHIRSKMLYSQVVLAFLSLNHESDSVSSRPAGYVSAQEGGWGQTRQHRLRPVLPGQTETSHQHTPLLPRPRPASYRKVDGSRAETNYKQKKYCDKLPLPVPRTCIQYTCLFSGTLFPFISYGHSLFPAFCLLIFCFFPPWSDPWGRDARQGCPKSCTTFFLPPPLWLSIFYPDPLWCQASTAPFHSPAYLIESD